jgi:putative transposase
MNNYYHLVIETPGGNLSEGHQAVKRRVYSGLSAGLATSFRGRFQAILVQKDTHEVCRYVTLNPIRAKTVRHPRQWKWSSHGATAGIVQPHGCLTVDEILSHFGQRRTMLKKYSKFAQAGIGGPSI